jgi:hypothetical protein
MGVTPAVGEWRPLAPLGAARVLDGLAAPWWIAGGWALDLFAGGGLRGHDDLDVVLLRRDRLALATHLADWDLHVVSAPGELRPWRGEPLESEAHEIWARPAPDEPWVCEFLLDDSDGDRWLFRRDPRVTRPVAELGFEAGGLPVVAPEIALLFKARAPDVKAQSDFTAVLPLLDAGRREWLAAALATAYPGHVWLERL